MTTPARDRHVSHSYTVHYPAHAPRRSDPHYKDFEAYRRRTYKTARCAMGILRGDVTDCDGPLELHHAHIEFAVQNSVDLARLERAYPGVSSPDQVGAWVESAENLTWLCQKCHRGHGGVHVATASDFEAEKFIRGLIS